MSSISLSGSKRRARSCKNRSISEGESKAEVLESKGADKEERERRGATSSDGPIARLGYIW